MVNLCIAGASGRMGRAVIKEATKRNHQIVGAISSPQNENIGRTLKESGLGISSTPIVSTERISNALEGADIYISFTNPQAELDNLPRAAALDIPMVIGTTGFTKEEFSLLQEEISESAKAIFSPNFSLGINFLFKLTTYLQAIPSTYDISITESHHSQKQDSPSGTAKRLCELISTSRHYTKLIHGREGISPRNPGELEVFSIRNGGIPGQHVIHIGGSHEILRLEHLAFSRDVFAQGALYAAEWLYNQSTPGIYSMEDVLFSNGDLNG
jgi:4-hydroxy-tetrahydrodipicolinate reductase